MHGTGADGGAVAGARHRRVLMCVVAVVASLLVTVKAAPPAEAQFSGWTAIVAAGITPLGITSGPDGNLWFTNDASIGRITPAGVVSVFTGTGISAPQGIVSGADGSLWFTNSGNDVDRADHDGGGGVELHR